MITKLLENFMDAVCRTHGTVKKFVVKREGKRPCGRLTRRWKDPKNI
jgi:hypothetical protein